MLTEIQTPDYNETIEKVIQDLETTGYAITNSLWSPAVVQNFYQQIKALDQAAFAEAGIGRENNFHLNQAIRSDRICWLDHSNPALAAYFSRLEELRKALNRSLFLGLFDYECLYAHYPPGAYYKKHLDAFAGKSNRKLSCILYLNPLWSSEDGGELLLYDENGRDILQTVQPTFGKVVIFLSEKFPHEVKQTQKERYSITGWFRVNQGLII